MNPMHRVARVLAAVLLTCGVATSALADCMRADQPSAEMACCQNGMPNCGPAMQAADCCQTHRGATDVTVAIKPVAPHHVFVSLAPVFQGAVVADLMASSGVRSTPSLVAPSPPNLRVPILRI